MIETNTRDISKASEGTTSVGENPSVNGDVTSDCEAKEHGLLTPKTDNLIYREDVVRRNDGTLLGVVTEVAGDSYSESSITDDDDDSDGNKKEKEGEREEVAGKKRDDNVENKGNNKSEHVEAIKSSVYQDDHKRDSLIADHVRVLWMDDSETTYHRNELTVVDRGFLQGDYVSFASDPTGQVGVVVNVNMTVDLLAPDGSTFKGVSSRDLKRIRNIAVGDYVISGPWLGRVDGVLDNVTVMFEDGSVCKIRGAELLHLRPIAKNLLDDGHCPYHPGQRVKARSSSIFKNGQWLSGKWRDNRLEGTVIKVTVGSVYVHWIASAGYGPDSSVPPAEEQSPRNLKLLSCFSHANWQLSDWCFFPPLPSSSTTPLDKGLSKLQLQESEEAILEETDQNVVSVDLDGAGSPGTSDCVDGFALSCISRKASSSSSSPTVSNENMKENSHIRSNKSRKIVVKGDKKLRKKFENYEKVLLIVNTHTKVDVAWQDGTLEQGLESSVLIPIVSPSDHDFVAEQYVMEKAVDDDDEDTSEIRRVGVIRSVDAKAKTACVNWLKQVSRPEDPREFEKEEIVSVYELEGHPDYDYCYGDVVVRLSPAMERVYSDFGEKNTNSNVSDDLNADPIIELNDKKDGSFEEACNDSSDLPWVGNITGLRNGDIEVTWADGMVSTVGPQAIYVVGRDDDEESIVAGSDMSAVASWETLEDDEMNIYDNTQKEQTPEVAGNNLEAEEETASRESISVTSGPLGFAYEIHRMASEMFSRGPSNGDSETSGENELRPDEEMHISDGRVSSNVSDSQNPGVFGDGLTTPNNGEISTKVEALCNSRPNGSDGEICSGGNFCSFKSFETAKDPLDHVFLSSYMPSNSSRKWLKKVQSDWGILQHNLPDGIYVRVYEDRMDLLRAVIVGAYGTPYQDGLFFFDFHLSPEYPDAPPSAHYHSGGWRINPNLYEEGKVCLSLLNTWTGRGNEVWDPQSSSILQILVSLQGLVLNSEPYYNEAGYDKQIGTTEGAKNSLSYNENTYLLNCKMIMFLIRKPPKDFEELVKEHFKQRGYYTLKACDAYMKGYLIGTLAKDASVTNKSVAYATSVGFKLMLAKLLPKLISSLDKVGADCHEFKHLQEP